MFAPLVLFIRSFMGIKEFNRLRGQAIALHAQVITKICDRVGLDRSYRQNMIRLARDNGKRLGLLA